MQNEVETLDHLTLDQKEKIDQLLEQINSKISSKALDIKDPSLMYGKVGMLLFLSYYQRYRNSTENNAIIEQILEDVFESLQSDPNFGYHLAGGMTGVFWVIRHLVNQNLLDSSILDGLDEIEDQFIEQFIDYENSRKNYDLFYGTIGPGLLLLERENNQRLIKKIVDGLDKMKKDFFYGSGYEDPMPAIRQDKNEDFEGDKIKEVYNMGMAHGSPSVMTFFALINQVEGIDQPAISNLINRIDSFVTYHQMDIEKGSLHPIWYLPSDPEPFPARLSWCYGDLSIACGHGVVGHLTSNSGFTRSAEKIGLASLNRDNMTKARLFDPCLCHGSSGNMHMYKRLFEYTGNPAFREAEKNWLNIGLEIHEQTPGDQIFKFYDADKFKDNYSFLEGLAGTGLAYLAQVDKNNPAWDRLLLLS